MRARLFIASLGILGVSSCGDLSSPPPGHVEAPGTPLVPTAGGFYGDQLAWTSDGSEVVYVGAAAGGSSPGLAAISISTRATRQIANGSWITSFVRAKDGERIYLTMISPDPSGGQHLEVARLHPASGAFEVLTTVPIGVDDHLEVSPDERFLVIGSTLHNVQTGVKTALPGGRAEGFSPDGSQVLYYVRNTSSSTPDPVLISTADGSSQVLHSTGDFHIAHRWIGNSPQLLRRTTTPAGGINSTIRLSELDALTGTAHNIAEFISRTPFIRAAWSPDGNILAAWIDEGSRADRTDRTTLYAIRSTGAPHVVGSVHGNAGQPVFSPNGTAVVYIYSSSTDFSGKLYLISDI